MDLTGTLYMISIPAGGWRSAQENLVNGIYLLLPRTPFPLSHACPLVDPLSLLSPPTLPPPTPLLPPSTLPLRRWFIWTQWTPWICHCDGSWSLRKTLKNLGHSNIWFNSLSTSFHSFSRFFKKKVFHLESKPSRLDVWTWGREPSDGVIILDLQTIDAIWWWVLASLYNMVCSLILHITLTYH